VKSSIWHCVPRFQDGVRTTLQTLVFSHDGREVIESDMEAKARVLKVVSIDPISVAGKILAGAV
jgi:hypothetical protein